MSSSSSKTGSHHSVEPSLLGISSATCVKYYCNEGLVPNVKRDKSNNYRVFDDDDINWIKSLICLKKCDFSIKEIKDYIVLCLKGKETMNERKEMLYEHRKKIESKISALNETLAFIDWKTNLFDKFLSGELEYYSYLAGKK